MSGPQRRPDGNGGSSYGRGESDPGDVPERGPDGRPERGPRRGTGDETGRGTGDETGRGSGPEPAPERASGTGPAGGPATGTEDAGDDTGAQALDAKAPGEAPGTKGRAQVGDVPAGELRVASGPGRWVLFATVLGTGMAFLDSTVVNVALPHIGADLHANLPVLQWTSNGYLLTLSALILLGGALGDRFGRRRIFVTGIVWFALASLACGLAPNPVVLIAARALQGIGGALLTPGSLALLQASFAPDQRARAVGAWSGLGGVAAAVGPFLGGWLVDGPGWRWVFLINLPVAAICAPVALRHVPESRDPHAHGRFDFMGALLCALALAGVTYALIDAPVYGASLIVLAPALGGLLLAVAFLRYEHRRRDPMLPLGIFAIRQFTAVNAVTICVYAAIGGFFFLAVLQLQTVVGYSALQAGTALLPTTALLLLLSARSGELGERIGPRIPLTVGPLLAAAGMLMMIRAGRGASYLTDILPALIVLGCGMVALVAPLTATVLASVEVSRAGLASGVNNAAARAAGLLAVAALPLLAGVGPQAYRSATAFDAAFKRAMPFCAGVLVLASLLAWRTVRSDVLRPSKVSEEVAGKVPEKPEGRAGEKAEEKAGEEAEAEAEVPEPVPAAQQPPRTRAKTAPEVPEGPCRPRTHYHCGFTSPPLDPGDADPGEEQADLRP
jgi:EmrB/QacA subfamily drug resistance transporter